MRQLYLTLKEQTAPAVEPITLNEAKAFLRVTTSDEDTLITSLIKSARISVEHFINQKLITQTLVAWGDILPPYNSFTWWDGIVSGRLSDLLSGQDYISLQTGPVQSVTHMKTYDVSDAASTFSNTKYFVDTKSAYGRLALNDGELWPSDTLRPINSVEIEFVAGYGAAASSVPQPIITTMYNILVHLYDCRGSSMGIPPECLGALMPYRVFPRRGL
jgi:hypothetical protein